MSEPDLSPGQSAQAPRAAAARLWPDLAVPVAALGLHGSRRRQLRALGLETVAAVLRHLPRRHEDRSRPCPLADICAPGNHFALVSVAAVSEGRLPPGRTVLRARLTDGSAAVAAVWWNRPHLTRIVRPGARLYVYGTVARDTAGRLGFRAPDVEPATGPPPGILPVYPAASGVTQRTLRAAAAAALARFGALIPDIVPEPERASLGLLGAATAFRHVHFPPSARDLALAGRSIAFAEALRLQVALALRRQARELETRPCRHGPPGDLSRRFREALPFALTAAQRRVLAEIEGDLEGPRPMRRLLHGDVGSGKTVVVAAAMLRAAEGGRQAALLAPTDILARQHAETLGRLYGRLCRVGLLTGTTGAPVRRRVLDEAAGGEIDVLVGTHALLEPGVRLRDLGIAVVDEQHRFGVRQRDALSAKGDRPDVLVTTATPIPRTLALTLYGDLDVSVLDELPPGRRPVQTHVRGPEARQRVYAFVRRQIAEGRQAYVVCPRIGEAGECGPIGAPSGARAQQAAVPAAGAADARSAEGWGDAPTEAEAAAAEAWAQWLARLMPEVRVGLLHGRLSAAAKEAAMGDFASGACQLLVATTVVEVGVDVAAATLMVVEDADRFGLAQLHQLRGRVGRGARQSWCVLIAASGRERLEVLARTADGFAIAEEDLRRRGPGERLGTRQHGDGDGVLVVPGQVDPAAELDCLRQAHASARAILARDPRLTLPGHAALRRSVSDFLTQ